MIRLQTHSLPDLIGLVPEDPKTSNAMRKLPGDPCHHIRDSNSYGLILSRRWGPDNKPMQCEVLWTRAPFMNIDGWPREVDARWLSI